MPGSPNPNGRKFITKSFLVLYFLFFTGFFTPFVIFCETPPVYPSWLKVLEIVSLSLTAILLFLYTLSCIPASLRWLWKLCPLFLLAYICVSWYWEIILDEDEAWSIFDTALVTILVLIILFPAFYISFKAGYAKITKPSTPRLGSAAALLVMATLCFWTVNYFSPRGQIIIKTNYAEKLNQLSLPDNFDPNENAWPYLEQSFAAIVSMPNDLEPVWKRWPADMNENELTLAHNWCDENHTAIEYLIKASKKPYSWHSCQPKTNRLLDGAISVAKQYRTSNRVLSLRAKILASEGNFPESLETLYSMHKIGAFLTGKRFLIEQLVGIALRAIATRTAIEVLHYTEPPAQLLADFQKLTNQIAADFPCTIDFTEEKLILLDEIQRLFTDDGKGGGHLKRSCARAQGLAWCWRRIDRADTVKSADTMYSYLNDIAKKTPAQLHAENINVTTELDDMTSGNPLLQILAPPFEALCGISHRCRAETDALIIILALRRFKEDTGSYPQSLNQLQQAGFLKQIPIDPFSGEPYIYRQKEGDFILYSFAEDLDDDNGIHDKRWAQDGDGDFVFWPVQEFYGY